MINVPILILTFNRPNHTSKLADILRKYKVSKIYVSSDGPRDGNKKDVKMVKQTRGLFKNDRWPESDIHVKFEDENLGCKKAVSKAITWFFQHVEQGIILEDDCLPNESFFSFCEQMLDRYKGDDRIMHISGTTFIGKNSDWITDDYYYSCYPHCWGWATWKKSWERFDYDMKNWPLFKKSGFIENFIYNKIGARKWTEVFDTTHADKNSSWAYRWTYSCWENNGLSVHPKYNLVQNIGFDEHATHTKYSSNHHSDNRKELDPPYKKPPFLVRDHRLDNYIEDFHFQSNLKSEIIKKLRKLKRWLLKY